MKLFLPTVSIVDNSVDEIALAIRGAPNGALWIKDLPSVPFDKVGTILAHLAAANSSINNDQSKLGDRLNRAYSNNLVFKDAWAQGKGGPNVDRKRVLDLSPERLAAIEEADPDVLDMAPDDLPHVLAYWQKTQDAASDKLLVAMAKAIGSNDILDDVAFNYRMVDYYGHSDQRTQAPRCGEHRDFGSFTLIHTTQPGLEIQDAATGDWLSVEQKEDSKATALMLFGWCTQIRSNGRIPAALHRVVDHRPLASQGDEEVPRRLSAILFCAPKNPETVLEPVLLDGEGRRYVGGVRVGQLRGKMARKWRHREGTENEQDRIYEEEEIRAAPTLKTQDDVVKKFVAV